MLPYMRADYRSGPLAYFVHLVGHKGENSLLSYLKAQDYAMSLQVESDHELDCLSDFSIKIDLTK